MHPKLLTVPLKYALNRRKIHKNLHVADVNNFVIITDHLKEAELLANLLRQVTKEIELR